MSKLRQKCKYCKFWIPAEAPPLPDDRVCGHEEEHGSQYVMDPTSGWNCCFFRWAEQYAGADKSAVQAVQFDYVKTRARKK